MSFISPMLLEKSETAFSDSHYLYEPKMDGHRLLYSKIGGKVTLYTRHNNIVTNKYPELLHIPIEKDVILDGEVISYEPETKTVDFERLMERFLLSKPDKIKHAAITNPVQFIVFDVLMFDGKDVRNLPLIQRKALLEEILEDTLPITKIRYIEERGEDYFEAIQQFKLEGMVAKRKNSRYVSKRSSDWLKVINWTYVDDVYITGFKKGEFGLLCAVKEGDRLRPAGVIEFGMSPEVKREFYRKANALKVKEDDKHVYVSPEIKCQVKTRNWTKKQMLRIPVFTKFIS